MLYSKWWYSMKNKFINHFMKKVKIKYPSYNNVTLDKVRYGLESVYLLISKLLIIIPLAFILGIFKEFIIFLILYNFIRTTSFGIHATKSIYCLISSILIFIIIPIILIYLNLNIYIKILISVYSVIMIYLYSPADTHKRPLVNLKRRFIFKIISTIIAIVFISLSFIVKDNYISNAFLFSIFIQTFLISPITYKIFKLPYNNYLNYKKEGGVLC